MRQPGHAPSRTTAYHLRRISIRSAPQPPEEDLVRYTAFCPTRASLSATMLLVVFAAGAHGQAALNKYGYPEKHAPRPTSQAITSEDLMTRLYIFSDDSMQGRQFGR